MPGIKNYELDDPGGRPTKYRPEYAALAKKMIMLESTSDSKLSKLFQVSKSTIKQWCLDHQDFSDAYIEAWDHVNVKGVEASLIRRAQGYEYTEQTIEREIDKWTGKRTGKLITTKQVHKQLPPDPKSIEMVLTNREPKRWPKGASVELDTTKPLNIIIHTEPKVPDGE